MTEGAVQPSADTRRTVGHAEDLLVAAERIRAQAVAFLDQLDAAITKLREHGTGKEGEGGSHA